MISSITGVVTELRAGYVEIQIIGFGLRIYCNPRTSENLHIDATVKLYTSLVVREDSITLYGFSTADELSCFEIIQSVSGFGPKVALAMLHTLSPDELRNAVQSQDVKIISSTPGVGSKTAKRFLLEIGDKLGGSTGNTNSPMTSTESEINVMTALISLGWKEDLARQAVQEASSQLNLENNVNESEILRLAIQNLNLRSSNVHKI